MSGIIELNGIWKLSWCEGGDGGVIPATFTQEILEGHGQLDAPVPSPIHRVLQDAGLIDDPNIGLNSLKARWVEEMYWTYRHTFTVPEKAASQPAWITFGCLEFAATVLLNGEQIGTHANAHVPARFLVTGKLRAGENLLIVQLSGPMHLYADKQSSGFRSGLIGAMTKRHWARHPQYQHGWDWNPRLINIGILGDVRLEWRAEPRLDQVTVFAELDATYAMATVTVRATVENTGNMPVEATLRVRIKETGQEVSQKSTLQPGENRPACSLTIPQPRLWWPVGHGEPFRYTAVVELVIDENIQTATRQFGARRVEMDQSPHPEAGRFCTLVINGRPIFCKGGNWVPADLLYSTVTPERERALVDLALAANFNFLRIWGGGTLASHSFLDYCDAKGVMVWHDLLFACAQYPAHEPAFLSELRREATYAVRELAHHPSLLVWCGNNEISWFEENAGYATESIARPHAAFFYVDVPRICRREDPSKLHWISSPWSPDSGDPNDPLMGDQHPWHVSLGMAGGADFWLYRTHVDRFPNEGGVLGASSLATLRQFLPADERKLLPPSWEHHDNTFARSDCVPGRLGHAYSTISLWLKRDPLTMPLEEYAFASALLQAEALQEYILNYRRRMFSSASAIFWMYNDSWPVTHGWSIVDYYLRRKLAYHPVRRAFQPITVVVTSEKETVSIYGVNDTPQEWTGELRYGIFLLAGGHPLERMQHVKIAANASTTLATFARAEWEALGFCTSGAFAVLTQNGRTVAQHRLFLARFHELALAEPLLSQTLQDGKLVLSSETFVWGVCLDLDGELPLEDNCIDLLPGIPYSMPWNAALGVPHLRHAHGLIRQASQSYKNSYALSHPERSI